jgi:hypothetical protein
MIASRGVVRSNQKPSLPARTSNTLEKKSFVIKTRTGNNGPSPQAPNKFASSYKEYPSVPSNNYGANTEQPAPAPAPKLEDTKDQQPAARQTNGFQRATPIVVTRNVEAEKREMTALLARKKELEDRKSELDRMIEDEDQKNIALSNVIPFYLRKSELELRKIARFAALWQTRKGKIHVSKENWTISLRRANGWQKLSETSSRRSSESA